MSYFLPSPLVYFVTPTIDLTVAGNTQFNGATSPNMNFFTMGVIIQILTSSGIPTVPARVKVGTNAGFNNIVSITPTIPNAFPQNAPNIFTSLSIISGAIIVPGNSTITTAVSTAATILLGNLTARMILWGFYF